MTVVTWTEIWESCDHAGCSGPEILTITAKRGHKEVTVSGGSCFGIDHETLIADLLDKWDDLPTCNDMTD